MELTSFVNGSVKTNSYLIWDDKGTCALIDPEGDGKDFCAFIDGREFKLTHILLTHGHFDHIGAVAALTTRYGCKVCIGAFDVELLPGQKQGKKTAGHWETQAIHPDVAVNDGDQIQVGKLTYQVLATPGHTKGGVCYLVENLLITGDTLFADDCGRTDLYGGDWGLMQKSLNRLYRLSGDYIVLPGHGPTTTLEKERQSNPYLHP